MADDLAPEEARERDVRLQRLARPALAAGQPAGLQPGAGRGLRRTSATCWPTSDLPTACAARAATLIDRDVAESIHFIQTAVGAPGRHHRRPAAAVARRPGRVPVAGGRRRAAVGPRSSRRCTTPSPARGRGTRGRPAAGLGRPDGGGADLRQPDRQRRPIPRPAAARPDRGRQPPGAAATSPAGLQVYYVKDNGLGIPEALPGDSSSPPSSGCTRTSPRARASAWPWCAAWSSGTAAGSGWSPPPAWAARSSSPCPRRRRRQAVPARSARRAGPSGAGAERTERIEGRMATEPILIVLAEDDDGHATPGPAQPGARRAGQRLPRASRTARRRSTSSAARAPTPAAPAERAVLLLLDIKMPRVDGVEVLRQLKADPRTALIPVIMLTTTDDPREIDAATSWAAASTSPSRSTTRRSSRRSSGWGCSCRSCRCRGTGVIRLMVWRPRFFPLAPAYRGEGPGLSSCVRAAQAIHPRSREAEGNDYLPAAKRE